MRDVRYRQLLEVFCVRHRHVKARDALYRRIQIIKSMLGNFRADLCAYARKRMRLFGDDSTIRFLYRFNDQFDVQRPNGARVDDFT